MGVFSSMPTHLHLVGVTHILKAITRLSQQLPFHPHFYLGSRQQQNITTNTPQSSNQINLYNDSEYCCGDKALEFARMSLVHYHNIVIRLNPSDIARSGNH